MLISKTESTELQKQLNKFTILCFIIHHAFSDIGDRFFKYYSFFLQILRITSKTENVIVINTVDLPWDRKKIESPSVCQILQCLRVIFLADDAALGD